MNMPEFTAEAALSHSVGRYRNNAVYSGSEGVGFLTIPQSLGSGNLNFNSLLWRPLCCCGGGKNKNCIQCGIFQFCSCNYGLPQCHDPVLI